MNKDSANPDPSTGKNDDDDAYERSLVRSALKFRRAVAFHQRTGALSPKWALRLTLLAEFAQADGSLMVRVNQQLQPASTRVLANVMKVSLPTALQDLDRFQLEGWIDQKPSRERNEAWQRCLILTPQHQPKEGWVTASEQHLDRYLPEADNPDHPDHVALKKRTNSLSRVALKKGAETLAPDQEHQAVAGDKENEVRDKEKDLFLPPLVEILVAEEKKNVADDSRASARESQEEGSVAVRSTGTPLPSTQPHRANLGDQGQLGESKAAESDDDGDSDDFDKPGITGPPPEPNEGTEPDWFDRWEDWWLAAPPNEDIQAAVVISPGVHFDVPAPKPHLRVVKSA